MQIHYMQLSNIIFDVGNNNAKKFLKCNLVTGQQSPVKWDWSYIIYSVYNKQKRQMKTQPTSNPQAQNFWLDYQLELILKLQIYR